MYAILYIKSKLYSNLCPWAGLAVTPQAGRKEQASENKYYAYTQQT